MTRYHVPTRKDWWMTGLLLSLSIAFLAITTLVLVPDRPLLFAVLALAAFLATIEWHTHRFAYRCAKCNTVFTISAIADFLGPQVLGAKFACCPKCHTCDWMDVLKKNGD